MTGRLKADCLWLATWVPAPQEVIKGALNLNFKNKYLNH